MKLLYKTFFLTKIDKNSLIYKDFKNLEPLSGEVNHCLDAFYFKINEKTKV